MAAGPREVAWREDAPATLAWVEALDGGDPNREAAERDRAVLLPAPFQGEPATLATLPFRFAGIQWGNDGLALVQEGWWKTRRTRTWIVQPGGVQPHTTAPKLLFDRSSEDRYGDPGEPLTTVDARGRTVLRTADGGRTLFLLGAGAGPEGDRPFLDALDLASRKTRRLFRSAAPYYEVPIDLLDARGTQLLQRRESVDQPPNYYVRDLAGGAGGAGNGQPRQLTHFPHPTPQLAGIHKELIRYRRADGVQLTATLFTPAGWKPADGPLPMLMWAYPQEFKSADAAGQVADSPYRFARAGAGSPLVWLTQGYAVLDNPSMPIVGEGAKEPNDTYVQQLVASAQAAVDEVVRRGVADRRRIAIGGHSYGAFTTANLLAHSDLFAAGIAESGAYNRTLTPFGFQAEERDIWHAPEIYSQMSPFMYADKVKHPLLMIHGQADNNSGTDPDPERALLQRPERQRRPGAPGLPAARIPRLPRPRVGAARAGGELRLAGQICEEPAGGGPHSPTPLSRLGREGLEATAFQLLLTTPSSPGSGEEGRGDEGPHELHLVRVHPVSHGGVDPLGHLAAHPPQHLGGLVHPLAGDVRIAVAAAEEDRRAGQRSRVIPGGSRRADQAAGEPHQSAIATGVAGGELEREAGALGEAEEDRPLGRNPRRRQLRQHLAEPGERRGEAGLVALHRRQEAGGIPGAPRRLRRHAGELRVPQLGEQQQDILRRGPAPVHHHHGGRRLAQRAAGPDEGLSLMRARMRARMRSGHAPSSRRLTRHPGSTLPAAPGPSPPGRAAA